MVVDNLPDLDTLHSGAFAPDALGFLACQRGTFQVAHLDKANGQLVMRLGGFAVERQECALLCHDESLDCWDARKALAR